MLDMIFDSHAHYDDTAFDEDRDELLASLKENGIGYAVDIGADMESSYKAVELAQKYPFIYAAVGLHPDAAEECTQENMLKLKEMALNDRVKAIGEIGLDYHYQPDKKVQQKICFEAHIDLAKNLGLPIVVHSREAAKDTMDIIKSTDAASVGGVIHCFSYSKEMAGEYADMGFYIGIGGVLTFNNAKKLKEAAEYIPLDRILLETDCPYLSPVPNRGKRNSSLNLPYVVKALAEIKGISEREVVSVTCGNALKMYKITEG